MGKCKEKFPSEPSLRRSAGMCLLFVLCMPLTAGCIHFFYNAGLKRIAFPAQVAGSQGVNPFRQNQSPLKSFDRQQWLALPAEPASFVPQNLETEVIRLTNQLRKENGKDSLRHMLLLDFVARSHSEEMARLDYFAHQSPIRINRSSEDRLGNAGLNYTVLAENIAKEPMVRSYWSDGRVERYTWGEVAQNAVRHWFASLGHRRNMLRRDVEEIGVGAAIGNIETRTPYVYLTQTFRTP